jgi:glycerol-3-phosphate acyltransferase PlsY
VIVAIYTLVGYAFGCVLFAYYLGRIRLKEDVREYGEDRNPGAVNAWKAGGWTVGLPGGILDFLKGFVPVFLAQHVSHLSDWALVPIAIAPVIGHAFSPLLRFRGGKALAAAFGMWAGLTQGFGFLALAGTIGVFYLVQRAEGWATFLGHFGLLVFLLIVAPQAYLLALWLMETTIVTWKHRRDMREPIRLRSFGLR